MSKRKINRLTYGHTNCQTKQAAHKQVNRQTKVGAKTIGDGTEIKLRSFAFVAAFFFLFLFWKGGVCSFSKKAEKQEVRIGERKEGRKGDNII